MLFLVGHVLCIVAGSVLLLPFALWEREIYKQYSGSRLDACPENQQSVALGISDRNRWKFGFAFVRLHTLA